MVVLIGNFADASQDASGQAALMSSFCLMVTMDSRKEKQAKKVEQTKVFLFLWELFSIIFAYIINKGGVV